jgi:hypothetical protein
MGPMPTVPTWAAGDDVNATLAVLWTEKGESDLKAHVSSGRCSFYSKDDFEKIKLAIEEVRVRVRFSSNHPCMILSFVNRC